jgi:spore maturation protein CgeB
MKSSLRILNVLPMYGGSLTVGRYCTTALRELGHTVEVFEAPDFHGAFCALKSQRISMERLASLENSFLQIVGQTVLAKAESFAPDLVLAQAQAPLSRQTLQRLRRDKVATAMWFVEDFQVFPYWKAFARHYDVFAVIQREPFHELLRELGQENVLYLPLAADPTFHRPLELSSVDRRRYGADISFMGAGYPNRLIAFRRLTSLDFKIWGNDWQADPALAPCMQRPGERISPEEAVRIFNATKINLNLHSSVRTEPLVSGGDFVNPRTFELAACEAFQLVDRRSLLAELFSDQEVAVFEDMPGMLEAIQQYLARPDERREMARRARKRVLAEHSYVHRMRTLVEFVGQRCGLAEQGGGAAEHLSPLAGLPEELQQDIRELLLTLDLPETVSFEDLVWAIRQRQGTLSDLETSVLFLDELRKQYTQQR